ncbi:MAG: hypothetical protein ACRCXZ_03765 [Patescibacteria group bacterium]
MINKRFYQTVVLDLPFADYNDSYFQSFVNRRYHGDIKVINVNCSYTQHSYRVLFQVENKENALGQAINPLLVQKLYDEAMECGMQIIYEISQYVDTSTAQVGVEFEGWNQHIGQGHSHPFNQLQQHFNPSMGRFNGVGHHNMYNGMMNQMGFGRGHQRRHRNGSSSGRNRYHGNHGGYNQGYGHDHQGGFRRGSSS